MTVAENIAHRPGLSRRFGLIDWRAPSAAPGNRWPWSPRASTRAAGAGPVAHRKVAGRDRARARRRGRGAGARRAHRQPAPGRGRDPVRGAALAEKPRRQHDLCLAPPGRGLSRSPTGWRCCATAAWSPSRRSRTPHPRSSMRADHRPAARGRVHPAFAPQEGEALLRFAGVAAERRRAVGFRDRGWRDRRPRRSARRRPGGGRPAAVRLAADRSRHGAPCRRSRSI